MSLEIVRGALNMYSEGGSVSAVARAMDINFTTVFTWVKKANWAQKVDIERRRRTPREPELSATVRKIRGIDAHRRRAKVIMYRASLNLSLRFKVAALTLVAALITPSFLIQG